ncbi:metallophosphoesterase [Kaarinaea lacus]
MKLHILSDLHRDLAGDVEIPALDTDLVLLAGDIDGGFDSLSWAMGTFTIPTLFVLGNHETLPGNIEKLEKFREKSKNSVVTVLENDTLEINGVRFLGCTLWAPTNQRMRAAMNNSIEWLREMLSKEYNGKTVVITHYPPLHQSLSPEVLMDEGLANRLSVDLRDLIVSSNISLWVHGHVHSKQDYICGKTRIVCNPRGYADMVEPEFNTNFSVEI